MVGKPYRPLAPENQELINEANHNRLGKDDLGHYLPGFNAKTARVKTPDELKKVCRVMTTEALRTVWDIMRDQGSSANTRLQCAQFIVERGFGKVAQTVDLEGYQGGLVVLPTVGGLLPAVDEGTTLAQECTSDEQKQG